MRPAWLLVALAACGPAVPPHLQVGPAESGPAAATPPDSATSAVAQLVAADPFLRRLPGRPAGWWDGAGPLAAPLSDWATRPPAARPLQVGARPAGILAPLAAGARLAALETTLRDGPDPAALAAAWGLPAASGAAVPADARGPMDWFHPETTLGDDLLYAGERAVLLAWLSDPALPLGPVDAALVDGRHDRWIDSPAGALLRAHARGARDPEAAAAGAADLWAATTLALGQVAADRDREQADWAATAEAQRSALGLEAGADPVAALLRRARAGLTADAGSDRALGLALVALQAERLRDRCPDRPCGGLDRIGGLHAAAAWDPEAARAAALWRLVAAKGLLDRYQVGHDRPGRGPLLDATAELWAGEFAGPLDRTVVQRPAYDPALVLALSRAAGGPDETTPAALEGILRRLVHERAQACADAPAEAAALVDRIRRRAQP